MRFAFLTAPVLVLTLLIQTAAAVGDILPCAPDHMAATNVAEMEHPAHHQGHYSQPDQSALSATDIPDCCDDMSSGFCAASGCAAGAGTAISVPSLALRPRIEDATRNESLGQLSRYSGPPSAIFRPPIV